jgi:hypothetical protein
MRARFEQPMPHDRLTKPACSTRSGRRTRSTRSPPSRSMPRCSGSPAPTRSRPTAATSSPSRSSSPPIRR